MNKRKSDNPYNRTDKSYVSPTQSELGITPQERAYMHVLRGLGLSHKQIADALGRTRPAITQKLSLTRERVEDGEDPMDVWEDIMRPLWEEQE